MRNDEQENRWSSWMRQTQAGDHQAYESLLKELARYLEPYLRKSIRSNENLQDLIQEILLSIHRARHSFLLGKPFKPWFHAVARHRTIDFFRQQNRSLETISFEEEWQFADREWQEQIEGGLGDELMQALAQLPEKQQKILQLLKLEDYSVKMAAQTLKMSESAVKVNAHRAYRRLRKKLKTRNFS